MSLFKNEKNKSENVSRPVVGEAQKAAGRRNLTSGAYASALMIVALVAVILLNLVVGAIPTKYTQFDISSGKMFTLSDTTLTALHALDRDITAYYLAETGTEDSNITRMLDRYAGESSHIRWEQRDPALYPTFAQQYGAANASSGSVILVCGDKSEVVDYQDMYNADYSDYYTTGNYTMSFAAENALTSGIAKVIRTTEYKLYQMTGHGETSLETDYTDTLTNAGVASQELNLVTAGAIPEDAAAVLINAPQVDFAELDVDALRAYLEKGGALLVTTDLSYATPNLDALLAEYGMTRQKGLAIETDANYFASRYPATYLLPQVQGADATSGVNNGMYVFTPVAQGIISAEDTGAVTLTPLLSSSASSYSMVDYATAETATKSDDDPSGPFDIAVSAENSTTGAKIVWVNCGNVFLPDMNTAVSGGNAQLMGSVVNWLIGEQGAAVIDAKSMSAESLTVPPVTATALGLLFVIVLPLACIIAGVAVFIIRRRR